VLAHACSQFGVVARNTAGDQHQRIGGRAADAGYTAAAEQAIAVASLILDSDCPVQTPAAPATLHSIKDLGARVAWTTSYRYSSLLNLSDIPAIY